MGTLKKRFFTSADPVIRRSLGFCRWLLELDCSDFELKRKQHQLFSFVLMSELVWTNSYLTRILFESELILPDSSFSSMCFVRNLTRQFSECGFKIQDFTFTLWAITHQDKEFTTDNSQFSVHFIQVSQRIGLVHFLERQDLILSLVFRFKRGFRN